ncbi:MAG: cupredoxin domain-containing protein [Gaiellaceae bacterium]
MRKALLLVASILGLAAAAVALAAVTRTVAIKPTGFSPATRTIQTGDSIRWRNDDTVNHQVVADNGHFASPVLRPKQTYTRLFNTSGTFRYRDALEPAERGTIVVQGPPPSVSIAASQGTVFYGGGIRLTGFISSGATNQLVEIWSKPFGQSSPVKVADLRTVTGGGYDYSTVPRALTEYYARWGSRQSVVVAIGVRPRITFNRRAPYFIVSARAQTPMAGRWVYVQRRSPLAQWVNVKKVRLGDTGAKRFRMTLKRGRNVLRIFMTTNQAGPGLLWSHSRTLLINKR